MVNIKKSRLIESAKSEVKGFAEMYAKLEQKVILGGLSASTLTNYGRCIAKISLYFHQPAIMLEPEQVDGYLQFLLTSTTQPSKSYFKHTVYGLRYLYRLYDREDRIIKLPSLKQSNKLPVVLSIAECKHLFRSGRMLKHRVLLSLIYSAGLRSQEVRKLKWSDMDIDRKRIHIRQTKYNKDRYVPLSEKIIIGLMKYKAAYSPKVYVFNGSKHGEPLSANGVQWAMKETLKASGINKVATIHTLRHSFATHLLEMGMDLDTLRSILGHAHMTTTMIYLHVARIGRSEIYSPFDRIY